MYYHDDMTFESSQAPARIPAHPIYQGTSLTIYQSSSTLTLSTMRRRRSPGCPDVIASASPALASASNGGPVSCRLPDEPGLGARRRQLLGALKRDGPSGVVELAKRAGLNVETVREHLATLEEERLVQRVGTRIRSRGRPEVLYGLADEAERLLPRREAQVLRHLADHLIRTGLSDILREAFDSYVAMRRRAAMERVEAAAGILTEMGFMAEVQEDGTSLRLCHCPYRQLVEVSSIPCWAEVSLVAELLGERPARTEYIPDRDAACSYRLDLPARPEVPTDGKVDQ